MLELKKNVVGVCKKNIKVYCQAGEIAGECGLHPRAPACASSVGPVYVRNMSTCRRRSSICSESESCNCLDHLHLWIHIGNLSVNRNNKEKA